MTKTNWADRTGFSSHPSVGQECKILHIGSDGQFLRFIAQDFEKVAPGCSSYVLVTKSSKPSYPIESGKCDFMPSNEAVLARVMKLFSLIFTTRKCDVLIAHGLTLAGMVALLVSPRRVIKIWSGFGADYYGHGYDGVRRLLGSETRSVTDRLYAAGKLASAKQGRIKNWVIKAMRVRAVSKADYFSAPIPNDYDVMRNTYPQYSGKYAQLVYGSVEREFAAGIDTKPGANVLVGNSSNIENNHLDLFKLLSRQDLSGRRVIVPLGYGDLAYRDVVLEQGDRLFGEAFYPLVDFLSLEEYVSLVASCGIVIMGHQRQAALANIGSALYYGARVYLDPRSTAYQFLVERGTTIFTLQNLSERALPNSGLSAEVVVKNTQVLKSFWGNDVVEGNVRSLLMAICQHKSS